MAFNKDKAMKALKIIIPIASIAAGVASNWLKEKEFDEKVAAKVVELTGKTENGES